MNKKIIFGYFLVLLAGTIYLLTLAPTYLWSDSAKLAIYVHEKFVNFSWGSHSLHMLLGVIFSKFSFNLAYTQNIMSAFFAILGLFFVYRIILKLTSNYIVSFISAVALGISQTYWHYAVINESYAPDIFFRALCLWLVFKFTEKNKFFFLYLFFFFFSLSLGNHNSHFLWLPGYLLLVADKSILKKFTLDKIFLCLTFFIFGFLPLIIGVKVLNNFAWQETLRNFFVSYYSEFTNSYFAIKRLPQEILRYPFYLAYQFPFLGFFIGLWGAYLLKKEKSRVFYGFLLLFLGTFIPASGYFMKARQFALLLPTYLVFSLYLGVGLDRFLKRLPIFKFKNIVIALILILPAVGVYRVMPNVCKSAGIHLNFVRDLPYRDKFVYYLWPPKNKEYGAINYVEHAFREAEPDAVIISDFNPGMALLYVQEVLGKRKDILLLENVIDGIVRQEKEPVKALRQIIDKYIGTRPVYLADIYEPYYFTTELKKYYNLVPGKALIRVVAKG